VESIQFSKPCPRLLHQGRFECLVLTAFSLDNSRDGNSSTEIGYLSRDSYIHTTAQPSQSEGT
jgi:hypothetical protein